MILFSHPTGNANVRHAALALRDAGMLGEFWTTVSHVPGSLSDRLLPRSLTSQLSRRTFPEALRPLIHTRPLRELMRMGCGRLGLGSLSRHEHGCLSVDAIYRDLDKHVSHRVATGKFEGVYAYEDGALLSFREARRRGIRCFYDQPIGHWKAARDLLLEEAQRRPDWAMTLLGNEDSPEKTERKDEELRSADIVFAASSFTEYTLRKVPDFKAPVVRIPYGAPRIPATVPRRTEIGTGPRLRALYVGSLGQRKGLSYLFDAISLAKGAVDLTIIGRKPERACPALDKALAKVHWIPSCSHNEVLRHMREADVFVFPSLFEGFGLVLLEAMAMGLPIICTPHTAGPDLITNGREGFVVPIRDSEAIAERLMRLHTDKTLLRQQSALALARAAEFTWDGYEKQLASSISQRLPTLKTR